MQFGFAAMLLPTQIRGQCCVAPGLACHGLFGLALTSRPSRRLRSAKAAHRDPFPLGGTTMTRTFSMLFLAAVSLPIAATAAEYLEKTSFQLSRAFSPGVVTEGGKIVWVAGQTATRDNDGRDISNNFEAQVKQVFSQI